MAAAVVPLVASLAPEIINLIASLVHQFAPAAEQKFGSGTGPVKFGDVFGAVVGALNTAAVAGQIPKSLPTDETIKVIIQAVVASMQIGGVLVGPPAPSEVTPQPIITAGQILLTPGQVVTIGVKT